MRSFVPLWLLALLLVASGFPAGAVTLLVSQQSVNPVAPYATWDTAATNIQDAVDAATPGDVVLVSNGVYQTGSRNINGGNRVAVSNAITVQSVNGPGVTFIYGFIPPGITNSTNSIRGVYLADHAMLSGFTVANSSTWNANSGYGAGVHCATVNSLVTNCIITGNIGAMGGGGVAGGTVINCILSNNIASLGGPGGGAYDSQLINCLIVSNTATYLGGGAWVCVLSNCTVVGNFAPLGAGGANSCTLNNCILYYNTIGTSSVSDANSIGSKFNFSCTTPAVAGAITNAPQFVGLAEGDFHLAPNSPCINGGSNGYVAVNFDLDGNPRIVQGKVDMGAYESQYAGTYHYVNLNGTNATPPYTNWATAATNIQDAIGSAQPGDIVLVTNGNYSTGGIVIFGQETNRIVVTNQVSVFSVNGPQVTTITGGTQMRCAYVAGNSVLSGFTFTNGQARTSGDIYNEMAGAGAWCEPGGVIGNCFISGNGTGVNSGRGGGVFGGAIYNSTVAGNIAYYGGGVWSNTCWNCVISNNTCYGSGAAAYGSQLFNCLLVTNYAEGALASNGTAAYSVLSNCTLIANQAYSGSAAYQSMLLNCLVASNYANIGNGGLSLCISSNCTLIGNQGNQGGGSYQGTNINCIISANHAGQGGGTYQSSNYNCLIISNSASTGGGSDQGALFGCTVFGNSATGSGGGVYGGTFFNCIIVSNTAPAGPNYGNSPGVTSMSYCCTTPSIAGVGNIATDPAFVDAADGNFQLACGSPCIDAGTSNNLIPAYDIRGLPRPVDGNGDGIAKYDMGAYEFNPATDQTSVIIPLFSFANFAVGYPVSFKSEIGGCADYFWWDFGDGVTVSNQSVVSHAWVSPGTYNVQLFADYPTLGHAVAAATAVQVVKPPIYYVRSNNPAALSPYTSWNSAATSIQLAIAAGNIPGRLVLVSNGVYQVPGAVVKGVVQNVVALTNPVIVQSVNGPGVTSIVPNSGRCAYVGTNAYLMGFTLTNSLPLFSGDPTNDQSGGVLWCEPSGIISNCLITGGRAPYYGGGTYQGIFYNCIFSNNNASSGGGAYMATLFNCTLITNIADQAFGNAQGGGAFGGALFNCQVISNYNGNGYGGGVAQGTLSNCVIAGNMCIGYGGGSAYGTLYNCLVVSNSGSIQGGGAYAGSFYNCTIASNSSPNGGGVFASSSAAYNSIIYDNASLGGNSNWTGSLLGVYSCSAPKLGSGPSASHNFTNDPMFVNAAAGDYHLRFASPCIDSGTNLGALLLTDLDGNPRPLDGNGDGIAQFDVGAYEFSLSNAIGASWFTTYGLNPADTNVFNEHLNGNSYSVLQAWIADTDPTNPNAHLQITSISNGVPPAISFNSSSNRVYTLQGSPDLGGGWTNVLGEINIPGDGGPTTLQDTNNFPAQFYRVVVSVP